MQAGLLKNIYPLLSHTRNTIRREACWLLSNITAGNFDQIQIVIQNKHIILKLIDLVEKDLPEVIREAAWTLSNASLNCYKEDIHLLFEM